tara:strand:- start:471 stop:680 length:210 start_codon:yes stop_codon:yes gene_type:complete
MVELKILENCLNILQILDKNKNFAHGINQSMINNLNNKHRFGAGFRSYILSVTAPSLCLLFIQQGEKND